MTETILETQTSEITPEHISGNEKDVLDELIKNYPEVAAIFIADKISNRCQNTGPFQLQRILKETDDDMVSLARKVSDREHLSNELEKSQTPIRSFLENFIDIYRGSNYFQ